MAAKTYRVRAPQQWLDAFAPAAPPHRFGIEFVNADGVARLYEEGELVSDFPPAANVAQYVADGWIEEVSGDGSDPRQ